MICPECGQSHLAVNPHWCDLAEVRRRARAPLVEALKKSAEVLRDVIDYGDDLTMPLRKDLSYAYELCVEALGEAEESSVADADRVDGKGKVRT